MYAVLREGLKRLSSTTQRTKSVDNCVVFRQTELVYAMLKDNKSMRLIQRRALKTTLIHIGDLHVGSNVLCDGRL
jgi:hypothetical protein